MAEQALAAIPNPIKGKSNNNGGLLGFVAALNLGELVIPLALVSGAHRLSLHPATPITRQEGI